MEPVDAMNGSHAHTLNTHTTHAPGWLLIEPLSFSFLYRSQRAIRISTDFAVVAFSSVISSMSNGVGNFRSIAIGFH